MILQIWPFMPKRRLHLAHLTNLATLLSIHSGSYIILAAGPQKLLPAVLSELLI